MAKAIKKDGEYRLYKSGYGYELWNGTMTDGVRVCYLFSKVNFNTYVYQIRCELDAMMREGI